MTYTPHIPPSGAVVTPPVHAETIINVVYTDGDYDHGIRAGNVNWSGEGDGPAVLGYEVVEEYRESPKPREWWLCAGTIHPEKRLAVYFARRHPGEEIVHVVEVME
jgi:hypothetical protein